MKQIFQIMSVIAGLAGLVVFYITTDISDGVALIVLGMTYLIYSKQVEE